MSELLRIHGDNGLTVTFFEAEGVVIEDAIHWVAISPSQLPHVIDALQRASRASEEGS